MFATLNHLVLRWEHQPEPGLLGNKKCRFALRCNAILKVLRKRLVIQEKKGPEKIALSCDVMLASQQKQLGRTL